MRKNRIFLLGLWLLPLLSGCSKAGVAQDLRTQRNAVEAPTQPGTAYTACSEVLKRIWESYRPEERFLVYGGDSQNFVDNGPGDLDMENATMLQKRFSLTEGLREKVTEGAALEQRLNPNVFCAGVFCLAEDTEPVPMALQWKDSLDQRLWSGVQPQRYLIAQPEEGLILIAYGQTGVLETFLIRMNQGYPQSKILMYQEIPQKISPQSLQ